MPYGEYEPWNESEKKFWNRAHEKGWEIHYRGWPDFFCILPNGRICLVEVKRKENHHLKPLQDIIMRKFSEFGIDCFKYTPDRISLKRIGPNGDRLDIWKYRKVENIDGAGI